MRKMVFSALVMGALTLVGCGKDNDDVTPKVPAKEVKNLDVSQANTWVYFSFSKGEAVSVTDPENDNTWDIAFGGYNVKTKNGALNTENKDFEKVSQAPSQGYKLDEALHTFQGRSLSVQKVSPVIYTAFNNEFWAFMDSVGLFIREGLTDEQEAKMKENFGNDKGWNTFNYTAKTFTNNDWVYVVKTADNKFAKIQLTGYTNDRNIPGFISFKYLLSNDGKF